MPVETLPYAWYSDAEVLRRERERDGTLRAFVNVCRHRGSVLVEGSGTRETIQCSYHAWTYDLDGTLRSAPRADELDGDGDVALLAAAVDTWGPFVFVNPDADAATLAESLGDLPSLLDVSSLRFHSRVEF